MPLRPRLQDRDRDLVPPLVHRCSRAVPVVLALPHPARADLAPGPAPSADVSRGAVYRQRRTPAGGSYSGTIAGSVMAKAVSPGTLLTSIVPWWALTSARTIARPKPVLPARRDRDESPRAKRSNISGC